MARNYTRLAGLVLAGALAAGSVALAAGPAEAKSGGGDRTEVRGSCTGGGAWRLRAKHDDGRVEIEFEVDTNKPGQVWNVKLSDNGKSVFSGNKTTVAPSGSFEVEKKFANQAGVDVIKARATRGTAVCSGTVRV
jgi:hypothetical protein